jgi:hydroxyacyl-ACP dehydratase HTD2-like protein with hotdog domain
VLSTTPDLVVHGPLTAMLLAQSASHHLGKPLQSFAYRASSPLFVDQPVYVDGVRPEPGRRDGDDDGHEG